MGTRRGSTDDRCARDGLAAVQNRVRVLRLERGWSQAELAQHLNVSRQTVNSIEREKYDPSLPLAFEIARLFELTIEQIFSPDGRGGGKT
jgi:putative transcriptional regulator